jgi:N-acetylmuramoyl-L-alanine amidase CwlA
VFKLVKIDTILAHRENYGGKRSTSSIKYIVIHFTANDGDKDENNAKYFRDNVIKASAHYFVDSNSITQSVPDNYVAYSVGGGRYTNYKVTGGASYYKKCTNANSISIELCDDLNNGFIYPSAKTIKNAIDLTEMLMKKYNIPKSRVIRHFDVNGKSCPSYWCGTKAKNEKWEDEFWDKLNLDDSVKKSTKKASKSFKVKVTASTLNVRTGVGTKYKVAEKIKKGEIYTIVSTKYVGASKWGKLKSGLGWINLSYTKTIK